MQHIRIKTPTLKFQRWILAENPTSVLLKRSRLMSTWISQHKTQTYWTFMCQSEVGVAIIYECWACFQGLFIFSPGNSKNPIRPSNNALLFLRICLFSGFSVVLNELQIIIHPDVSVHVHYINRSNTSLYSLPLFSLLLFCCSHHIVLF